MSVHVTRAFSCFIVALSLLFVATANAAESDAKGEIKLLWPNGAPGAKGDTDADKPSITIYRPDESKNVGCAVVICPGGGYGHLAMDIEGSHVAKWLNDRGITGIVLKYRLGGKGGSYSHPAPMLDVQRAMRMTRSMAKELKVDAKKIGLMGFSAGGHLASTGGTHYDKGDSAAKDPIDQVGCRPDFLVLIYPAVSMGEFAHKGSREILFGKTPDPKMIEEFSNEKHVTKDTPPTFMVHTTDDKSVVVQNSLLFFTELQKNKIPSELHVYEKGGHGYGLGAAKKKNPILETWPGRLEDWLKNREILK